MQIQLQIQIQIQVQIQRLIQKDNKQPDGGCNKKKLHNANTITKTYTNKIQIQGQRLIQKDKMWKSMIFLFLFGIKSD